MASKDHGWSHTHSHTYCSCSAGGGWGWEGGCGAERCMGDCGFVVQEPHASDLLNIFDQLTQKACAYSLTLCWLHCKKNPKILFVRLAQDWTSLVFWYQLKCVICESYFVRLILIFHIIPDLKLCCQLKSQNKLMLCSQTSNPQDVVFKASPKIPNMVYVSKMMSKTCVTFSLDGNGKAVDNMEPPVLIISLNF